MSVHALAVSSKHTFTQPTVTSLTPLSGLGVAGDCHLGAHTQHRSQVQTKPRPANLRQVHLIPLEVLAPLRIKPGQIGENITTTDVDLSSLGQGTRLHFLPANDESAWYTDHAIVVVQGVRNPGPQIEKFRKGLKEEFIVRDADKKVIARGVGVMGTVEAGGPIKVGMSIVVEQPEYYEPLQCV